MAGTERFLPSRDGFAFTNAWPSEPDVTLSTPFGQIGIGNADAGLCGGMVFGALDYWHSGTAPPAAQPASGEPLYRYLVQRLVDSWNLPTGAAQYYQWMNLPDGDTSLVIAGQHIITERGLAWRTIQTQWPQITADLGQHTPVALGVVTVASASPGDLGLNHQVLAYDYETAPDQVTVRVYDPNSGQNDGIHIQFDPRNPANPTTFRHNLNIGRPVRGFFRTPYTAATPPGP
jgi:hypothetical protein